MAKEEEEGKEYNKKKILTIFILFFPSILIALIPSTLSLGTGILWSSLLPIIIKILLVFYQFVVLKNFIDTHYET